ncbi:hypothetical protein LOK49_LG01G01115 [Camellia lanceoleosa]|uniref:Uncharacterized protein n=1 Tax=Camellia lanceoleosa TaxID=1840588 RepID=A0ACC0IZ72_9ERIC|nr:hypothetical protein LOK49_LG01G01115 [Camellia lanceoleosa]
MFHLRLYSSSRSVFCRTVDVVSLLHCSLSSPSSTVRRLLFSSAIGIFASSPSLALRHLQISPPSSDVFALLHRPTSSISFGNRHLSFSLSVFSLLE